MPTHSRRAVSSIVEDITNGYIFEIFKECEWTGDSEEKAGDEEKEQNKKPVEAWGGHCWNQGLCLSQEDRIISQVGQKRQFLER